MILCNNRRAWCGIILLAVLALTAAVVAADNVPLVQVDGPCGFRFPQDHGAHEGFRTEWWYYTGNLADQNGRPFGFQLTFFRTRLAVPAAPPVESGGASAWRTPQIYLAHLAVTDVATGVHRFSEEMARGVLGLAGVASDAGAVTVRVKKWSARLAPDQHHLKADDGDMALDLVLSPLKPPVAHGDDGYSRKGSLTDQASCYYSLTRLAARGTLRLGAADISVSGLAWMDHEFSTAPLDEDLVGWDWFSLQLEDGTDLMLYRLRDAAGSSHAASSGTVVDPAGRAAGLPHSAFSIEPEAFWESPETGARYPVAWRVNIPGLGVDLSVTAAVKAQEMRTGRSAGVVYWEGSVVVAGAVRGKPARGRGYLEMTGYAGPFDAPL